MFKMRFPLRVEGIGRAFNLDVRFVEGIRGSGPDRLSLLKGEKKATQRVRYS